MSDEGKAITQSVVYAAALAHFHVAIASHLEEMIAESYQREALVPDQVRQSAKEVSDRYGPEPFSIEVLTQILSTEWDRVVERYERGLRGDAVVACEKPKSYESYSQRCPFCGTTGSLDVIEVTLSYQGELVLDVDAALSSDGFDIYDQVPALMREKDLSTQDEQVHCRHCDQQFELSLVTLD